MSVVGQKATSQGVGATSALTPKSDIKRGHYDVR